MRYNGLTNRKSTYYLSTAPPVALDV